MSLTAHQVDEVFSGLGLPAPGPTNVSAIESIPDNITAELAIEALPEVQTQVVPVVQMFELATGHDPLHGTLANLVGADMTLPQMADALISSQTFANLYNGGAPVNPNVAVTPSLIDAMFLNGLGHVPSAATEQGFAGLTVEQAFLDIATSPTMAAAHASDISLLLTQVGELSAGTPVDFVGVADHAVT
jgi:hypothetical protein